MPPVLPEFDCDIFISYQVDDSVSAGWVKMFAHHLEMELKTLIPNPINIEYWKSTNQISQLPKSLLFIPVIIKDYCDINSTSWKDEFCRFHDSACSENLGMSVKVNPYCTYNRILPAKISFPDKSQMLLLEKSTGEPFKTFDFVYEGQDRLAHPLSPDDNLNDFASHQKMAFRSQLNKLALVISDILKAVKNPKSYEKENTGVIFIPWTSADLKLKREELILILQNSGMMVIPQYDCPIDEEQFKSKVKECVSQADVSVHLLSDEYGRSFENEEKVSFAMYQFEQAKLEINKRINSFRIFINYFQTGGVVSPLQESFIQQIRNGLSGGIMFMNATHLMYLAEDLRQNILENKNSFAKGIESDLLFIHNFMDADRAEEIKNEIKRTLSCRFSSFAMNGNLDGISDFRKKVLTSRLTVVFSKDTHNWARPFVQYLWNLTGGANSKNQIAWIGETEEGQKSDALLLPGMINKFVEKKEIVEEIKKIFNPWG